MEHLPLPRKAGLFAVVLQHAVREPIAILSAKLTRRGPLTVLDGGNCFPFYRFARLVRREAQAARRLYLRRAFTCHQMLALLESTPGLPQPYLVPDLLGTFYDEQISEWEVDRLLDGCLRETKRLCLHAPVILLLFPARLPERAHLLERVCEQADQIFITSEPVPAMVQPSLF